MKLTEIIKNQDFFKKIEEKFQKNLISNAILYFCEDEIMSKTALILTAMLFEYQMFEMFDDKSAEYQKIEKGIDLDVKVYPKNGDKLLVSDSNEIVSECYIKPANLPYKIFLLNNFDISTEEAQNKLLKVLEEPPKNVYFILSAKSEERVLPTIKSRCEKIKIAPLSQNEISTICDDKLACALGEGYVGKTLALSKNEDLKQIADFGVSLLTELKSSKDIINFSKKFVELKDNINLILKVVLLAIEDIIKIKCESENLVKLKMYIEDLKLVEPEFSIQALCEISKMISNFLQRLEFNANLNVATDNLLLKMLEVKFLCK